MTDEKPTGDAGASISERLEGILAREDGVEPSKDEGQAAPEPGVKEPAGDALDEDEGPQYELPDVAKVLGLDESMLDVDEDGSLKIKTKVDGQEGTAKLQDLIKSYQLQGHVDAKVRQVAEQERQVVERVQQYESFAQSKFQELEALSHAAQQMLVGDYASINWDQEFENDPVGAPRRQYEFQKRQGQVQQFLQHVNYQKQQVGQALQQHQAMELARESQRLAQLVPEWSDTKVREAEGAQMREWLQTKGVSPRSINSLTDAGLVAALRAGMLAEKSAPTAAAVEKKVRTAPKLVRPGKGTDASERRSDSVRGLKQQIRESGGKAGIAEYLIATGKV
jgi:hypothetical protein